jgi:hypothetical protein
VYLPRLKNTEVLQAAIREGVQSMWWEHETFAYADSYNQEKQVRRFYGSVKINPRVMAGDAGKIMEEVVKQLMTLYGANVQVSLEIQAHIPGGVPEETVRTVTENCRTLRFDDFGFEEE